MRRGPVAWRKLAAAAAAGAGLLALAGGGLALAAGVGVPAGTDGTTTSGTTETSPQQILFRPTSGPPGTAVVLQGSGFSGATSVTFGGASAAFTVVSDYKINATVPQGAATGAIFVTTPSGSLNSSTLIRSDWSR